MNERLSSCAPNTFDGFADDRLRVLVILFLWLNSHVHLLSTAIACQLIVYFIFVGNYSYWASMETVGF